MDIDVKLETERVQQELAEVNTQLALIAQQIVNWQNQRQQVVNSLLKKTGELELLQRLNGQKEGQDAQA